MPVLMNLFILGHKSGGAVPGKRCNDSVSRVLMELTWQSNRLHSNGIINGYELDPINTRYNTKPIIYIHRQCKTASCNQHGHLPCCDG